MLIDGFFWVVIFFWCFLDGSIAFGFISTHSISAHFFLKEEQPLFGLLDFAVRHIILNLVVDFLCGACSWRLDSFFSGPFRLLIGVIEVVRLWRKLLLSLVESVLWSTAIYIIKAFTLAAPLHPTKFAKLSITHHSALSNISCSPA